MSESLPAVAYRWRDSNGVFHHPREMETRHLFYVLRMIWNHSMPPSHQIKPFQRYRFGSFYTREYFAESIIAIGRELLGRSDLKADWLVQLETMAAHFEEMRPESLEVGGRRETT